MRSGAYRRRDAYRERKDAFGRALLAAAEGSIPGLAGRLAYQEVATPLTQARYTGSTGGTSYGIALTPEQFLGCRPEAGTETRGLYLCGRAAGRGTASPARRCPG